MNSFQISSIAKAQNNKEKLDDWENDFIKNISSCYSEHDELSEAQNHCLNEIRKKCDFGY